MKSLPITIIRTTKSLLLLTNAQTSPLETPLDNKGDYSNYSLYRNHISTAENNNEFTVIQEHFEAIKNTNSYDAFLLARITLLLYKTTPRYDSACILPDITEVIADAPRPNASPRHTRAFKGTKDKRPTAKSAGFLDIRKILMDPQNLSRLLDKLWPYRHDANNILEKWGYSIEYLLTMDVPPTSFEIRLKHTGIPHNEKTLLSALFNEEIMPILIGEPWSTVHRALHLYYTLKLEKNDSLRATVCRLLTLSHIKNRTLSRLKDIAHITTEKLTITLTFIIEKGIYENVFDEGTITIINTLAENVPEEFYPTWAYTVIESLARGVSSSCLYEHVTLALEYYDFKDFSPHYKLDQKSRTCDGCDALVISSVVNALPSDDYTKSSVALCLWTNCSHLDGLINILKQALDLEFSEKHLSLYIELFIYPDNWHDCDYKIDKKWTHFKKAITTIQEHMKAIDESYIKKWYDIFTDCINLYTESSDSIVETSLYLASRLSREPFLKNSHSANAISKLLKISGTDSLEQLSSIPDSKLLVIDKACKIKNDGSLIAWGLSAVAELEPSFMIDAFNSPKKLVKVLKTFGPMSWENKISIIKRVQKSTIFTADYEQLITQPKKIIAFIDSQVTAKQYNPTPKALREHINGDRNLSGAQLSRHLSTLAYNIPQLKLQALEECVNTYLLGSFNTLIVESNIKHALKLYHSLEKSESKRAYKRFLDNYLENGTTHYRDNHPLSQQWLQEHPNVDANLWTHGLPDHQEGDTILTIEREPLEALKMGTYVGSCLGLGGIWTESAVAILLDINKQVLYARNTSGVVIARQTLAISEQDQLVAFEVYPQSASKKIKNLFTKYNQLFAAALELPLFKWGSEDDDSYDIALILAKNWWDDGAWDGLKAKTN